MQDIQTKRSELLEYKKRLQSLNKEENVDNFKLINKIVKMN